MPKGVEHISKGTVSSEELRVKTSLMPKGVEHGAGYFRFHTQGAT